MGMEDYIGGFTGRVRGGQITDNFLQKSGKLSFPPNKEAVTCLNIITHQTDTFEKEHKNFNL